MRGEQTRGDSMAMRRPVSVTRNNFAGSISRIVAIRSRAISASARLLVRLITRVQTSSGC